MTTTRWTTLDLCTHSGRSMADVAVGEVLYAAAVYDERTEEATTEVSRVPFRTSLSREELLEGWLGCSFGRSETAIGTWRVVRRLINAYGDVRVQLARVAVAS